MVERVRVGIIGAGRIADLHVQGYQAHPAAEIVSVCDSAPGVAERRAAEWGAARCCTDYRDLLDDPEVDAVDIITPHNLHAPMAVDALEAGKHVSLQKPMAIDVPECEAIIAATESGEGGFRVFENFRFYPPLVEAKRILDGGAIGEPISIRMKAVQGALKHGWAVPTSTLAWRYDEAQSGGGRVVFDYGYHLFSVALHFLGPADRVFAWINETSNERGWVRDSPAMIVWKYRDSRQHGSWEAMSSDDMVVRSDYWTEDEWFEISGTRGFIWVNRCTGKLLDRPPLVVYADGETTETHLDEIEWDWAASFRDGMIDFIDAVLEGRQSPIDGREGLEVLKFARAAQESSRQGREVYLAEIV
jgi:predicted dehydrogenase